jgi:uncharacterized protein YjbI with pentapeptide repeats
MKITKEQVLENLEDVKKYIQEAEDKVEKKKVCIEIKNRFNGEVKFSSEKETIKEACMDNKANLYEADLYGANLREADLRGADFSGAYLSEADLRGANLREADLYEADLREADLSGADLSGANLYGANLREADLYGANLYEANLSGADLREANLREAEMQNVKFFGNGGNTKIKRNQIDDLFKELGIIVED